MKRLIVLVVFLLQRYYDDDGKWSGSSYFSAIMALLVLVFINCVTILMFLGVEPSSVLPVDWTTDKKWVQYLKFGLIFFLPGYFVITRAIKEDDVQAATYDEELLKRSGSFLVIYILLSITLLFAGGFVSCNGAT